MIIKNGSRGKDVKELQRALKVLGYNVGVSDGIFGTATEVQRSFRTSPNYIQMESLGRAHSKK